MNVEFLAAVQVALEIHGETEQAEHLQNNLRRRAGLDAGAEQTGLDLPVGPLVDLRDDLFDLPRCIHPGRMPGDMDHPVCG